MQIKQEKKECKDLYQINKKLISYNKEQIKIITEE